MRRASLLECSASLLDLAAAQLEKPSAINHVPELHELQGAVLARVRAVAAKVDMVRGSGAEGVAELRSSAGSHLDPNLVGIFLGLEATLLEILTNYADEEIRAEAWQ